ncbi:hypothetical protein KR222_003562, partial [Zaprionus bogoriensis]
RDQNELQLMQVLEAIDDQEEQALLDLQELVKFKSISVDPKQLVESCEALDWVSDRLAELKFRIREYEIARDPNNCVDNVLQKVLFANYFSSPSRNTLLIYGHVDVLPTKADCWLHDPFNLTFQDGLLYGRGVSTGKGMIIGWIQAIEAWLKVNEDLPINIKFIVEMLHQVGSTGLQSYVEERRDFFLDVDYMLFDVNSWLNESRPIVACSLTGWAYFGIDIRGGNKNVETGVAGGLVYEPMNDLCQVMNNLINNQHEMVIPHMEHLVRRLSVQEWQLLETAEFSTYKYKDTLEIRRLKYEENKVAFLQSRWCKSALTMHGVEGSDSRTACSKTLPMMVVGKFSIRLVPDQEVFHVHNIINEYMHLSSKSLDMGTKLRVQLLDSCDPISWSTDSRITKSVVAAVTDIFGREPVTTTAIPICLPVASIYRKLVRKPIILLPYSKRLDRHQQENESVKEALFMRHTKLCATLMAKLSYL